MYYLCEKHYKAITVQYYIADCVSWTPRLCVGLTNKLDSFIGRGFPGGQMVKNLPTMQEIQVQSLGQEDALEKGLTTHSSTLAWRIPWTEEPGGLQFIGSQRVRHD